MDDLHSISNDLPKDSIIVDVRTEMEFDLGHVPDSVNIPHDILQIHSSRFRQYDTVYLYCKTGVRALLASKILEKENIKNIKVVDKDGMPEWVDACFPVSRK